MVDNKSTPKLPQANQTRSFKANEGNGVSKNEVKLPPPNKTRPFKKGA